MNISLVSMLGWTSLVTNCHNHIPWIGGSNPSRNSRHSQFSALIHQFLNAFFDVQNKSLKYWPWFDVKHWNFNVEAYLRFSTLFHLRFNINPMSKLPAGTAATSCHTLIPIINQVHCCHFTQNQGFLYVCLVFHEGYN